MLFMERNVQASVLFDVWLHVFVMESFNSSPEPDWQILIIVNICEYDLSQI